MNRWFRKEVIKKSNKHTSDQRMEIKIIITTKFLQLLDWQKLNICMTPGIGGSWGFRNCHGLLDGGGGQYRLMQPFCSPSNSASGLVFQKYSHIYIRLFVVAGSWKQSRHPYCRTRLVKCVVCTPQSSQKQQSRQKYSNWATS